MNSNLPPGMYKDEEGNSRYWDGSQWLVSDNNSPSLSQSGFNISKYRIPIAIVLILVLGTFGYRFYATKKAAEEERQTQLAAQALFDYKALTVKSFFKNAVGGLCEGEGIKFDDTSLVIDGKGKDESTGANIYAVYFCVIAAEMPESTQNIWQKTTSLQGRVEDEWKILDGDATVKASWTYHPDNGPDITLKIDSVYLEKFDYSKHASLVEGLTLEGLQQAEEERKKEKEESSS